MQNMEQALSHAAPSASSSPNFSGQWQNDLQSKMFIAVNGKSIAGTYTSAVSAKGVEITGDLSGYINGDLISFCVNWPTAAITAWVGQLTVENGSEVIKTLWLMTENIPDADEPTKLWGSITAGANNFRRV